MQLKESKQLLSDPKKAKTVSIITNFNSDKAGKYIQDKEIKFS